MSQIKKYQKNHDSFKTLPKKLLIKNAHVIDLSEKLDDNLSIIIENNKITDITKSTPGSFKGETIDADKSVVMPGFFDMHVHLREPGRED